MAAGSLNFNIALVVQRGRLQFEALLFLASLRRASPECCGRVFLAEPQPGPLWPRDPRVQNKAIRRKLEELGGTFLPFETCHFGHAYPHGNKIEMLQALPEGEPFVFFDTDSLITGALETVPFDFHKPSASLKREGTWPKPELYGPTMDEIWAALYRQFGLNFESSLDHSQPENHWRRYLYFNAGFFYGACPRRFGAHFLNIARTIQDDPPKELSGQKIYPWLDQIALPLVIHTLGGGRDTLVASYLDEPISCHYRKLPLLFAKEADHVVDMVKIISQDQSLRSLLQKYPPYRRFLYEGAGMQARALFDQTALPRTEHVIRKRLKAAGLWSGAWKTPKRT
jgi:hypothetical protein